MVSAGATVVNTARLVRDQDSVANGPARMQVMKIVRREGRAADYPLFTSIHAIAFEVRAWRSRAARSAYRPGPNVRPRVCVCVLEGQAGVPAAAAAQTCAQPPVPHLRLAELRSGPRALSTKQ